MSNKIVNLMFVSATAALSGCMVGPDYVAPNADFAAQDLTAEHFFRDDGLWKEAVPADSLPKGDWWAIFNDPELDALLRLCRENNPDLASAFYRVEQARQNARMDASELYPFGSGDASFTRTEISRNVNQTPGTFDTWRTGLGLTWDLDLFGRVRSIVEADIADAQASYDLYQNLILTMQANVASYYFTIRQYSSELELLERTLETRKEQSELVRNRVKLDYADDLDLQRALQQEYEAAAQLATVSRQKALAKVQIAILVGVTPSQLQLKDAPLSEVLPKLPQAVPSELLERRPDVAAAERAVYAANARIGAAQAGFFPTVSISADASLQANKIDKLLNASSFAWGVSPQIYIPIFQAGKIYAQKQVALAAHKETLESYKATVLKAIGEVESALTNINLLEKEYEKRSAVTEASLKVQELTTTQYDLGSVDYFSVSDAQRLALLNEREQLRLLADRFRACVDLITSLGGGWKLDKAQQDDKTIEAGMYEGIQEFSNDAKSNDDSNS